MITQNPALDVLHRLVGAWTHPDATLEIRRCGRYGLSMDFRAGRAVLCGVFGAHKATVEAFLLMGLPGVARFEAVDAPGDEVHVTATDPALEQMTVQIAPHAEGPEVRFVHRETVKSWRFEAATR